MPWVEKAIEEKKQGKTIVMLLRVDTSTRWFAKIHEAKAQILWINGRLRYRKNSYKRFDNTPVPWASMLVIFKTNNNPQKNAMSCIKGEIPIHVDIK